MVLRTMNNRFSDPTKDEGIDEIYKIPFKLNFDKKFILQSYGIIKNNNDNNNNNNNNNTINKDNNDDDNFNDIIDKHVQLYHKY